MLLMRRRKHELFVFVPVICKLPIPLSGRDGASQEELKWTAGAVAILLGWIDFLMHLTHLPLFGLYIAMFSEVRRLSQMKDNTIPYYMKLTPGGN